MAHMTITRLPKRIHALSLAAALGASAFVLPGASAVEAEAINVNDCLTALVNSEFNSSCPYEDLEIEVDTIEIQIQSIKDGQATIKLVPLYEGGYVGDASRVYLVMQYYDATGTLLGSDTYEPSAMQVERADDGSMLVTFEMPQMPQEGYYSMSVMDLTTSDEGYGEFMISEGSLVPHAIPIEDDSDEVMVDKKENAHQVPTIDELKTMEKLREEEQNQQGADQKGSKDKVKAEVPSESAENPNLETHTQKLEQVPGGSTSSRDTQTLNAVELKVAYAEVRSDKETKPVTISAARLPANAAGYDLIVVETDMSGNHKGDALSITHISSDRIVNGTFKEEIGMPGSLLKTGSVYTAYLVRADDTEYAEEVVSVRFKVSGEATGNSTSLTKDESPRQDASASLTPSANAAEATGATQGSPSAATSAVSTRSDDTQSGSGQSATSAPRSTLDAVSAMSKAKEAKAERQRQALQALAQARTIAPRSAFEPTRTNQISAYSSGSDPASIAAAANSAALTDEEKAASAASGNGNKGFTPVVHSESNNRSATVNSNTTQVHSNANADRQDGVKAAASAASPASEEVAQHGVAFWALGGAGLALVVGAAWMAHRRGVLGG
ncbi:MAG: hypothetical protein HXO61_09605 [Rothia mucilaginosa]|uniref:Uncharacterized protein n=2 Tax=Rothia mucilaginosa TaxID=43675 RepID=A0A930L230_9MICC|nr:hypothetical protein [Rothia mucilaginosa]